jgi:hypothetical protein
MSEKNNAQQVTPSSAGVHYIDLAALIAEYDAANPEPARTEDGFDLPDVEIPIEKALQLLKAAQTPHEF